MMSADDQEIELDLSEDESLPWLESDEDEADAGAFDSRQIVTFVGILLALLAVGLLAVWQLTKQTADPELIADGSTITAPEGPYKEKPEDPGGKEFAGTGNVAPSVGEGETPEGVMAGTASDAPGPSISTVTTDDVPVEQDGVGVQVGAYGSRARAEVGWQSLVGQTQALSGVRYRVVKGEADIGTVYRLQAVAKDLDAANALCRALKNDGVACQVKR